MSEKLIDQIKQPSDLKKLDKKELKVLADELREIIVNTVSKNGGHLSSNLGVVELTLALHKCFSSPEDKIIFDVGHQSYVHKILTGRYENFSSLRQIDGISGFQNIFDYHMLSSFISSRGNTIIFAVRSKSKDY